MKTRQFFLLFALLFVGILSSCEYDFIKPEVPPVIDPTVQVSFAQEIVPIFNTGNNCTACHKTGATAPDLTAANAFASIVPNLINTANAEASRIYWHPHPTATTHPFKKLTVSEAALILVWIQQGAKNN